MLPPPLQICLAKLIPSLATVAWTDTSYSLFPDPRLIVSLCSRISATLIVSPASLRAITAHIGLPFSRTVVVKTSTAPSLTMPVISLGGNRSESLQQLLHNCPKVSQFVANLEDSSWRISTFPRRPLPLTNSGSGGDGVVQLKAREG